MDENALIKATRWGDTKAAEQLLPLAQQRGELETTLICLRLLHPQRHSAWQALQAATSFTAPKPGYNAGNTQDLRNEVVARALVEGTLRRGVSDPIAQNILDIARFVLDAKRARKELNELAQDRTIVDAVQIALLNPHESSAAAALHALHAGLQQLLTESGE